MEKLDWIAQGVPILTWSRRADRILSARRTVITRVNKVTFSVEHPNEPRFSLDDAHDHGGNAWDPMRHAAPLGSDEAQAVLMALAAQRIADAAYAAVDVWQKNPTRASRLGAIAALQAVQNDKD